MNRILCALTIAVVSVVPAATVLAHQGMHMTHHAPVVASSTITGEVVDTGCYLADRERGEKHAGCAAKCIARGMPMGLVTPDATVYLLTMNHDNADPYNSLKRMAGMTVVVTGPVIARGGMKAIDVTAVHTASQ